MGLDKKFKFLLKPNFGQNQSIQRAFRKTFLNMSFILLRRRSAQKTFNLEKNYIANSCHFGLLCHSYNDISKSTSCMKKKNGK